MAALLNTKFVEAVNAVLSLCDAIDAAQHAGGPAYGALKTLADRFRSELTADGTAPI